MEQKNEITFWDGLVTIFMIISVFAAAVFIEIVLLSPIVASMPNDILLRGMTWIGGLSSAVGITLLLVYKLVGVKSERQSNVLWFALILEILMLTINGIAAFAVYRNVGGEIIDFLKLLGPVNAVVTILAVSMVIGADPQRKSEFMSREWKLSLKQQLIDGRKKVLQSDEVNRIVWDTTVTEVLTEVESQTGVRIPREAIASILSLTYGTKAPTTTRSSEKMPSPAPTHNAKEQNAAERLLALLQERDVPANGGTYQSEAPAIPPQDPKP
ncbi:MAG: hypothetical protein MOGMAGMI_02542 [Candidatus Omnitrophica bacterium]|nr:hypothetical protein [Candidatus Omnitrophota bacterium]